MHQAAAQHAVELCHACGIALFFPRLNFAHVLYLADFRNGNETRLRLFGDRLHQRVPRLAMRALTLPFQRLAAALGADVNEFRFSHFRNTSMLYVCGDTSYSYLLEKSAWNKELDLLMQSLYNNYTYYKPAIDFTRPVQYSTYSRLSGNRHYDSLLVAGSQRPMSQSKELGSSNDVLEKFLMFRAKSLACQILLANIFFSQGGPAMHQCEYGRIPNSATTLP